MSNWPCRSREDVRVRQSQPISRWARSRPQEFVDADLAPFSSTLSVMEEAPGDRSDTGPQCRPVTLFGNPVLRQKATPVTDFGESVKSLVDELFATMYSIPTGVGLAANQIGRSESVFVFDCKDGLAGCVVNPRVELIGSELQRDWEACLSLPGVDMETTRHEACRVSGFDADGVPVSYEGDGLRARCFQHETDHLRGLLYIDLHSVRARKKIDAEMKKLDWYGRPALDPTTEMYRMSQSSEESSSQATE